MIHLNLKNPRRLKPSQLQGSALQRLIFRLMLQLLSRKKSWKTTRRPLSLSRISRMKATGHWRDSMSLIFLGDFVIPQQVVPQLRPRAAHVAGHTMVYDVPKCKNFKALVAVIAQEC